MKFKPFLLAVVSAATLLLMLREPSFSARAGGSDYQRHDEDSDIRMPVQEQETVRKTFTVGGAHKLLDVDNVFGSIEVVGTQSDQVHLVVSKSIRAESQERLEAAKKEVTLDITDQPDLLKFYVNGPFRCNCNCDGDGCCGGNRNGDHGYVVKMDFQLQVPRSIDLSLRTVNMGRVSVRDVTGNFSVRNVNGGIEMQDVGGGKALARTVNGSVRVVFRENPKENGDFGTINGPVDLYFARGLSADFRFKTMNGHIYTDFEMTSLPAKAAVSEHRDGKFIFRTDRYTGGRVGAGGMEIKADNLNGDIRVLERHD